MKFFHTDIGLRQAGDVLQVTISSVANVRLMDASNFIKYKNGMKYIFTGVLARESPIRLIVPAIGHWHVTIDTNSLDISSVPNASVKLLRVKNAGYNG